MATHKPVKINGLPCKDPSTVTADDFFYSGLHIPQNTSNPTVSRIAVVSVRQIPGLNTQGILVGRADYGPHGYTPPQGCRVGLLLQGSLLLGFVSSFPRFTHFNKLFHKGDAFVVPQGLVHYLYNRPGKDNVAVLFAQNSQDVGYIPLTLGVFAANPDIDTDFLAKAY